MQIAIISTALAIVLFLCFLLAFLFGLRLGKTVSEGKNIPTPMQAVKTVIKEVKAIKQEHEQDKADKKYNEALERLYSYTGEVDDET
jgi:hypothetical protein